MMRYDRSVAISARHHALLALVKAGTYSSPTLAKKLRVSEPTIYRDILFLKRQGYCIEAVRRSANWAYRLSSTKKSRPLQSGERDQ